MWNNLRAIWREPSSKRLAAALLVSVLIHAWLFGGLNLSLPAQKGAIVLEARLQPLAPLPKPRVAIPKQVSEASPPQKRQKAIKPQPAPQAEQVPVTPEVTESAPAQSQDTQAAEAPEPTNAETEQQTQDEGLVINEHPYDYVETYFDIRTKIDGPVEGKAKSVFNVEVDQYRLDFVAEAGGMAGLLLPELVQYSEGGVTKTGLQPLVYRYQFGNRPNKARKATFNWQDKSLEILTGNDSKTEPLVDGAQDVISFMYQFMYVAPLQKMQLNITNGKSFREYDYDFAGEETLNLGFGDIQAYHIVHNNTDNDEKVELWLAQDYQFIPVKIRKIDKEGKVYEFTATRIETSRPSRER